MKDHRSKGINPVGRLVVVEGSTRATATYDFTRARELQPYVSLPSRPVMQLRFSKG